MTELRRDMVKDSWVLIVPGKALQPADFPINKSAISATLYQEICPFCEGNEGLTTNEIAAVRPNGSKPNTPGWLIRTIPNKFAAFEMLHGNIDMQLAGIYSRCRGLGKHEVIIETPRHDLELHELSDEQVIYLIDMIKQRYTILAKDKRIKYIQIYKNRGLFAGASQEHSHTQILAYPLVPDSNRGLTGYYRKNGECLLCRIIKEETSSYDRVIFEGEHFLLLCPYASRFSYEAWIIPKTHRQHFCEINNEESLELLKILKDYIASMLACLQNPSYNIMINSAPLNEPYKDAYHWYIEIIPRLLIANGVEIASGYFMNPVAPELAAAILRDALLIGP